MRPKSVQSQQWNVQNICVGSTEGGVASSSPHGQHFAPPRPPSCPSAISPLCGPGRTSQHILSAAETGRNPSAETHLQEGKRSQLLTSPCFPNVTAADSQAEVQHPITKTLVRGPLTDSSWRRSQKKPLGQWSPTVTASASHRRPSRGVSAGSCCFGFDSGLRCGFWSSGPLYLVRRS